MIPYMVGKHAPNSTHFLRRLVKNVSRGSYFRAVLSQNGDKIATSPAPQPLNDFLYHSPLSWASFAQWSALMPKTLRSSRRHPIHSFPCPPHAAHAPTSSPNITHFDSLVYSMHATNPANKISLLREVASILSLPVFISVSR